MLPQPKKLFEHLLHQKPVFRTLQVSLINYRGFARVLLFLILKLEKSYLSIQAVKFSHVSADLI